MLSSFETVSTQYPFIIKLDVPHKMKTNKRNTMLGIRLITIYAIQAIQNNSMKIKNLASYVSQALRQDYPEQNIPLVTIQKRLYDVMLVLRAVGVVGIINKNVEVINMKLNVNASMEYSQESKMLASKRRSIDYLRSKIKALKRMRQNLSELIIRNRQIYCCYSNKIAISQMLVLVTMQKPKNCIEFVCRNSGNFPQNNLKQNQEISVSYCNQMHSNMEILALLFQK